MIHKEKQQITISEFDSLGIQVSYTKSRETLYFSGWFDHFVGIPGDEMNFVEFCEALEIQPKTLRKALKRLEEK